MRCFDVTLVAITLGGWEEYGIYLNYIYSTHEEDIIRMEGTGHLTPSECRQDSFPATHNMFTCARDRRKVQLPHLRLRPNFFLYCVWPRPHFQVSIIISRKRRVYLNASKLKCAKNVEDTIKRNSSSFMIRFENIFKKAFFFFHLSLSLSSIFCRFRFRRRSLSPL